MTRALLVLVVGALVLAGGSCRIEEDSPAWDCDRMGNRSCGQSS